MSPVFSFNVREVHEALVQVDTLRPADRKFLRNILASAEARDWRTFALRLRDYYHDADRADRTPRALMYLHLGIASGTLSEILE